ncbi:DNA primase family protein [Secundilactobacillus mixtipabuli]|uniref:Phage primase n=1 Tax=Secundilactobacillus mixtipabuli TaxID=1435342 RepID=A0A1Z5I9I5_9LACO|nr:phage/plasmid primase, P4 family [Secundilactobacillus mixtipabuli]GAW98318.1 phage primase [Secundilactobacillus mixtipabuli]
MNYKKTINSDVLNGNFDTFIEFENDRNESGYYSYDDIGMAQRMVDSFKNQFIYVPDMKSFYYWNSTRWEVDKNLFLEQCFNAVVEHLSGEPSHADESIRSGSNETEAKRRFIAKERSHSGKKNAIEEIKSLVPVAVEHLDADENLINTPSGVLKVDFDNRRIDVISHNPEFLLTKITNGCIDNFPYEGSRWEQFLNEIFLWDLEIIEFVQRAVGYSLVGLGRNQLMFILFGDDTDDRKNGSNGKSVFLNAISNALGDYAWKMNPESIIADKRFSNGSGASPDIVSLQGKRFVTTSELESGTKLNEALIKSLLSGEKQNARPLYKGNINFRPTITVWLSTNYKPQLVGTDSGIYRRLVYIPFLAKFSATSDPKIDVRLSDKLDEERNVIFQWIIDGARKYLENEAYQLVIPKKIQDISEMERKKQDIVGWFIEDRIKITHDKNDRLTSTLLLNEFEVWAKANNQSISRDKFSKLFSQRFLKNKGHSSFGSYYSGMRLLDN